MGRVPRPIVTVSRQRQRGSALIVLCVCGPLPGTTKPAGEQLSSRFRFELRRATLVLTLALTAPSLILILVLVLTAPAPTPTYLHSMDAFASIVSYFVAEQVVEDQPELPTVDEDKSSGSSGSCVVA
ncbi:hypothetical protein B0H11DRAFT_2222550 [Mycena galericulata]|nr:hypothetical protein B0H11DRAFT_2222550 [Mycena galericulata]